MGDYRMVRTFPLEDIRIRSSADGRTVEAYAAVFDSPVEIADEDGRYIEELDPRVFTKSLRERGLNFGVFYNHGMTLHRTPSDRFSVPLGTPVEIRPDKRGLLTVTRYSKTPLADEVLENIRNGAIRGQSFSGRPLQSNPTRPRLGWGPDPTGKIPTVRRTEIALREYGPTPNPAYADAEILAVRSATEVLRILTALPERERIELSRMLSTTGSVTDSQPAPVAEQADDDQSETATSVPEAGSTEPETPADTADGATRSEEPPTLRDRIRFAAVTRRSYLLDLER